MNREEKIDCAHFSECLVCNFARDSNKQCFSCALYIMLDSGYGSCCALPTFVVVPWCRVICGMYRKKKDEEVTSNG